MIGMYLTLLSAFSQVSAQDDSAYKKRKLSFEEANLITSYYKQDGNNAAVTGGLGSEKLTDISNVIDLKMSKYDKSGRKHTFTGELGIDHYTSASSDKIDPSTISSASSADLRVYPSLGWTMVNTEKGNSVGAGMSFSAEYDYTSIGANASVSKKTKNKQGEFTAAIQVFLDQLQLIYPIELRGNSGGGGNDEDDDDNSGSASRNTFSGTLGWSQIINKRFQVALEAQTVYQKGYLSLPFHRVYFNDNTVHVENLPATRLKIPLGIRANYFLGDNFIIRTWYRYYADNWGINSNTLQLETVIKINPFISVTPFYRYYQQTAADYFEARNKHSVADTYHTSNYDLSAFNSNFFGGGIRLVPPKGILNFKHISSMEIRYGHYSKNIGMRSNILSLHLKFK